MDESSLVERVFLRVASTETDDQFEAALDKFLPGLLVKLSSNDETVRKKVMELLVHVNKRLKSRPSIKLPVEMLLGQYREPANPPMVTNFTIIYIKMGVPRLPPEQQAMLFSQLVLCMDGKPQAHQDSLLQLLVPMLGNLPMPSNPAKRKAEYSMEDKPQARQLLLDFMLDILMLPYSPFVPPPEDTSPAGAASKPAAVKAPPCFSELSYKRALGDPPLSAEMLEKTKVGILRFLASDVFPEQSTCVHFIVASADSRHSVVAAADVDIRRITAGVDWNSRPLVVQLYAVFQGTIVNGKAPGPKPKADAIKAPAPVRLRLKMFPYLMKSRIAAELFPQNVQMVFDCLLGFNTNPKLRHFGVQFIHRMTECASSASLRPLGRVFMSSLLRVAESEDAREDALLRGTVYSAMGKVVHKLPELVVDSASCVQMLFQKLCEETAEVKMSIQQALVMMAPSYSASQPDVKKIVEALALQYVEKEEPQARMMAVHFAHHVFPSTYPAMRFVLLIACGDPKDDVRTEAEKLLHSSGVVSTMAESAAPAMLPASAATGVPSNQSLPHAIYPPFPEMAAYLHQMAKQRLHTQLKVAVGMRILPFNASAFAKMLSYLRTCLISSARAPLVSFAADDSFASLLQQAPAIATYVHSLLEFDLGDQGPVQMYIALLKQFLAAVTASEPAYYLLEIVSVAPDKLPSIFANDITWLKDLACCLGDEMVRYIGAQLLAVVCVDGLGHDTAKQVLEDIYKQFSAKLTYEKQCGSLFMMAHLVARHALRRCHGIALVDEVTLNDSATAAAISKPGSQAEWYELTSNIVRLLVHYLTAEGSLVLPSICLKDMGCRTPLCIDDGAASDDPAAITKHSIVRKLVANVQDSKIPYKSREKIALCLGGICVGDASFPWRQMCVQGLLDSVNTKELELSFGVGDALVMAALGPYSSEARDHWQVTRDQFKAHKPLPPGDDDMLAWLLDQLLSKYLTHTSPHIRQASCIWLLTVVKACSSYPALVQNNERIQTAFMQLLAEPDEVTQDIASKGLGLTYENSSEDDKVKLMTQLVDTLMTGKRSRREVTNETQVFEEGALGKTLDGQNMTTYRELCSIASDLNQPDLVYKFMNLANHNSVWNTRKGAAFGFSGLATQAGKQLMPHLAKIVPRLYRYMFDPNTKVQMAMRSIWNAVVSDMKEAMDIYAADIMDDVISHLTDPQWRVRESCCCALGELLKGRPLNDIIDSLPVLWETLLRVRDDIKESVRKAADSACTLLSRATVKTCDSSFGKAGEKAVSLVLPTLLHSGLLSPVAEVRDISLKTILSVSKAAGRLLQPHVDVLVPPLLEMLSGLEPQQLNYLSLQVTGSGREDVQEQLDAARAAMSKSSPLMECINLCLQQIDAEGVAKLVPRLAELLKSGVGLTTKTSTANVVVTLVRICPKDVQPHAGKLLAALVHGLGDRNATVRKCYATAIGHLAKVAKDESIEKLVNKLKGWYIEKDDDGLLHACGQTLRAMSESCPDVLQRHGSSALPLAFVAMHMPADATAQVSRSDSAAANVGSVWQETWNEMVPGTELGLRLYLNEILAMIRTSLQASSWNRKAVGAAALSTVVGRMGTAIDSQQLDSTLAAVTSGLAGRTWKGKESLLDALRMMAASCTDKIKSSSAVTPQQIVDCAMKEAKKESDGAAAYRASALRCLSETLQSFEINRFADVMAIVGQLLQRHGSGQTGSNEESTSKDRPTKNSVVELRLVAYDSIARAFHKDCLTAVGDGQLLANHGMSLLLDCLSGVTWKEQQAVLKALRLVIQKIAQLGDGYEEQPVAQMISRNTYLQKMIRPVCDCLTLSRHSSVHQECLMVLDALVSAYKGVGGVHLSQEEDWELVSRVLADTAATEGNEAIRSLAGDIKKKLDS